jgi:hypothetical protein
VPWPAGQRGRATGSASSRARLKVEELRAREEDHAHFDKQRNKDRQHYRQRDLVELKKRRLALELVKLKAQREPMAKSASAPLVDSFFREGRDLTDAQRNYPELLSVERKKSR